MGHEFEQRTSVAGRTPRAQRPCPSARSPAQPPSSAFSTPAHRLCSSAATQTNRRNRTELTSLTPFPHPGVSFKTALTTSVALLPVISNVSSSLSNWRIPIPLSPCRASEPESAFHAAMQMAGCSRISTRRGSLVGEGNACGCASQMIVAGPRSVEGEDDEPKMCVWHSRAPEEYLSRVVDQPRVSTDAEEHEPLRARRGRVGVKVLLEEIGRASCRERGS